MGPGRLGCPTMLKRGLQAAFPVRERLLDRR